MLMADELSIKQPLHPQSSLPDSAVSQPGIQPSIPSTTTAHLLVQLQTTGRWGGDSVNPSPSPLYADCGAGFLRGSGAHMTVLWCTLIAWQSHMKKGAWVGPTVAETRTWTASISTARQRHR